MRRPCFLVLDREFPGSISTRKLVIETAKLNVITAYDPDEAIETLERFPNVDGVVFDAETEGTSCSKLAERLRAVRKNVLLVVTSAGAMAVCGKGPYYVESHDPGGLLNFLKGLCESEAERSVEKEEPQHEERFSQDKSKAS